jgi:hypothetical protein
MEDFCVKVPAGTKPRIANALANRHRYDRFANPGESRGNFATRMLQRYLKNTVLEDDAEVARRTAEDSVRNNPNDPIRGLGDN